MITTPKIRHIHDTLYNLSTGIPLGGCYVEHTEEC